MKQLVFGAFKDAATANNAIESLKQQGYSASDISVITQDNREAQEMSDTTGAHVVSGAATGATTGGVIGALAGLLIGLGAIAIPGIGGVLIGGPLAAALGLTGAAATTVSGALTGALAGGIIGGLVGIGVPEDTARAYEETVKAGGVVLAVPAQSENDTMPEEILQRHNADQISKISVQNM
jgi:Heat induced stress protein YflT